MASKAIVQNNEGGLNVDDQQVYVYHGDYLDALDVQPITTQGRSIGSHEIRKGNVKQYQKTVTLAQNKKIRINGILGSSAFNIRFLYTNGVSIGTTGTFSSPATLQTAINTLFSNTFWVKTFTLGSDYLILELAPKLSGGSASVGFDYQALSIGTAKVSIVTIQEAYDINMQGEMQTIGSFNMLNDSIEWSCSINPNIDSSIKNIQAITAAFPAVVTINNHGYSTGAYVTISGLVYPDAANGVCLIERLTANTFSLLGVDRTSYPAYSNVGQAQQIPNGLGEIGVAIKNENDQTWNYTPLIKSKKFNFSPDRQIDAVCEDNAFQKSFYWTDDFNPPAVMYYKGNYAINGFLNFINSQNIYDYEGLIDQINLQDSNPNLQISFDSQTQAGGFLLCGNYRYAARLVSVANTNTTWSLLSNEVAVSKGNIYATPNLILGDDGNVVSGKANVLNISGNIPSTYKYVEVAYIQYNGNSFTGKIFKRVLLTDSGQQTIQVIHNGDETDTQDLDIGTLNTLYAGYRTAKNIAIIDNRMTLSNLTIDTQYDFSEYAGKITYSIEKQLLPAVMGVNADFQLGEYKNPYNVFNNMGYMLKERYRFYVQFKLRGSNSITQPFYIDDVVIDCTTTTRKVGALSNYDLNVQIGGSWYVYVPYVNFYWYDLNFLVGGIPVRELVEEAYIMRVDLSAVESKRQILSMGMMGLGVSAYLKNKNNPSNFAQFYYTDPATYAAANPLDPPSTPLYGMYPFVLEPNRTGVNPSVTTAWNNSFYTYPGTGSDSNFTAQRKLVFLYNQDVQLNVSAITYNAGDQIINYGQPSIVNFNSYTSSTNPLLNTASYFPSYIGTFPMITGRDDNSNPVQTVNVNEVVFMSAGDQKTMSSFATVISKYFSWYYVDVPQANGRPVNIRSGYVAAVATDLTKQTANQDKGFYFYQYYRPLTATNQYGTPQESRNIVWTGASLKINSTTSPAGNSTSVFGGDVFTQESNIRLREPIVAPANGGNGNAGMGSGVLYYAQNLGNCQLRGAYKNADGSIDLTSYPFPTFPNTLTFPDTIYKWTAYPQESFTYNNGYTYHNNINSFRAFNANNAYSNDLPTTIAYSDIKSQGSIQDSYRTFLPLNRKDLDLTFGEIIWMGNTNGELFCLQKRKYVRLFFNSSNILITTEGSEAVMGDGGVLTRKPQTLSTYGCQHKWSVVVGRSAGGNDTVYWWDVDNAAIVRFGADGVVPISIRGKMDSFVRNNIQFLYGKDTPANGTGICGVWNDLYKEVIWSVRANKTVTPYDPTLSYDIGEVVAYTFNNGYYTTFNKTQDIYICTEDSAAGQSPQSAPSQWSAIPHNDKNYYNEYSIVWNEVKNKFVTFRTPLPKIFVRYKNTFVTPRPVSPVHYMYEENTGDYGVYYLDSNTGNKLQAQAFIESVINYDPNLNKTAEALRLETYTTPERVEVRTVDQYTYMTSADFTLREGHYDSPVKSPVINGSSPDADNGKMFGDYIAVKFIFAVGVKQLLRTVIMKIRPRTRYYNR